MVRYNYTMWFVYIVRCADNSLYTGITTDVARRLREHNGETKNGARYTKMKRPVIMVYMETKKTRSSALKREYAIKTLSHTEKNRLIAD